MVTPKNAGPAFDRAGRLLVAAIGIVLIALLWGCSTAKGPAPIGGWDWTGPVPDGYYLIRRGDTLTTLAKRRGVTVQTLAGWNALEPPYAIYAGRLLRVVPPDGKPAPQPVRGPSVAAVPAESAAAARKPAGQPSAQPSVQPTATSAKPPPASTVQATPVGSTQAVQAKPTQVRVEANPGEASGVSWAWPLAGSIVQKFNEADRTRQGLRIRGRDGETVMAAAAGTVVYSGGGLAGYGNLIIIKHNKNYLSAYGFNRRLLVAEGDRVKRGQAVAEVGEGVGGGGYLLHFEIRRDGTAVDPMLYLPPRK